MFIHCVSAYITYIIYIVTFVYHVYSVHTLLLVSWQPLMVGKTFVTMKPILAATLIVVMLKEVQNRAKMYFIQEHNQSNSFLASSCG